MKLVAIVAVAGSMFWASSAYADDIDNAIKVCALIDGSGLTSEKCDYSYARGEIVTTVDMEASEARDFCVKFSRFLPTKGISFGRGWTLKIKSPYSGNSSIAYCALH